MSNKLIIPFVVTLLGSVSTYCQPSSTAFTDPPAWSRDVIWYQIFVERFYNGDKTNDPGPANISIPPLSQYAPEYWSITPWTMNWFERDDWAKSTDRSFSDMLQYRRYGGDLQGVLDKLDYLQELGVTALFINPINDAPSLHKYDARYYHHVDVNFGPDPAGDNAIMASENPADPTSWKWTAADRLFLKLVDEIHKRKMKIIMDYSWNHVGTTFWAWQNVLKNQRSSPYKDWFAIDAFDDPSTRPNEFAYQGWLGIPSLPEIKKVSITTPRLAGHPYEGDLASDPKKHIFAVTSRWLAPDGDTSKGIDGYRLDVADQIGLTFWRDFRKHVRSVQPASYLVGEIWWEKWPDQLMNPAPYTKGDVFDAVMFYQVYRPARYFFSKNDYEIDATQFRDTLMFQWNRLRKVNRYAMMNVSSSHDTPRLLTDFYNHNKYKFNAKPDDNSRYKTNKPGQETYQRVQLYLTHLFTSVGAPHIWNGEEMGMWGADDPYPRKPLMWKEFSFQPETRPNYQEGQKEFDSVTFNQQHFDFYKKLIRIRKSNPVLSTGEIEFIKADGKILVYRRFDKNEEIRILFNLDTVSHRFELPKNSIYHDLLSGKNNISNEIVIRSLQSSLLKKMKR